MNKDAVRKTVSFIQFFLCVLYFAQYRLVAADISYGVRILNEGKLTNSILSDTVPVTFQARNETGTLDWVMLEIDGHIFRGEGAVLSRPIKIRPRFEMDTCFLENGRHEMQIQAAWRNINLTNFDDRTFYRKSDLITITVSNEVYYPEWESEVGDWVSAYFFKTTHTNVDWQLDIFDARKNFVQRLSGHTLDGKIEAYWNLKDAKGVLRTNAEADPEFSSVITVDDPSGKRKIIKK